MNNPDTPGVPWARRLVGTLTMILFSLTVALFPLGVIIGRGYAAALAAVAEGAFVSLLAYLLLLFKAWR